MAATKTIPIVMVAGAPLQSGFIKSLSEPGGNVTGLSGMDAELGGKRIQVLRELIPNLNCVGVLATTPTTDPFSQPFVADIQAAAKAANLRVSPVLIGGSSELEEAFALMARDGRRQSSSKDFSDRLRAALYRSRTGIGLGICRRIAARSRRAGWFLSRPISCFCTNRLRLMWTRFSRARIRPVCRSSNLPNFRLPSITGQLRHWDCRFHQRLSPKSTKLSIRLTVTHLTPCPLRCPLLAQSGHPELHCTCRLLTQSGHRTL